MKLTSKLLVTAFASAAMVVTASAAKIVGQIDFVGAPVLNGSLSTATQVTSWGANVFATQATGSFAPVNTIFEVSPSAVTIAAPWTFNSGAVTPLWTVAGFSFDLTSSAKSLASTATFLDVSGSGFMSGNGFEKTFGTWTFNITNAANSSNFSFQSSTASVPDGGATVALLGLSFLGLGGVSRFVRRK